MSSLRQLRLNLREERIDVLRQCSFAFAVIEFLQSALLTLNDVAANTCGAGFRVAGLDGGDEVHMVPADLFQRGESVTASPCCKYADQQTNTGQDSEASFIASELHEVGVEGKVGDLKALHLFIIQSWFAASLEFLNQSRQGRSDGAEIPKLGGRKGPRRDSARCQPFQGFPQFEQLPNVIPVEGDDDHTSSGNCLEKSLADQLPDGFAGRGTADAQFLGDADIGNRFARSEAPGRNLSLYVVIGHFAHRPGGFRWSGHVSKILSMYADLFFPLYTGRSGSGACGG